MPKRASQETSVSATLDLPRRSALQPEIVPWGIDPRAVVAFVAVVEHQSFRAAARALSVPPSTVSYRVAELEERLGVRLLARTTRSVKLTDVGAGYFHDVRPALEAMQGAESRIAEQGARPRGHLRLTAPFELGQKVFGVAFARYAERFPDVKVTADLLDRQVNLVEEGYDLAIRVGPLKDTSMIAQRLGERQRIGLFASRAYLRAMGTPKTPDDLLGHRCLVMTGAQTPTMWTFSSGRKTLRVHVPVHYAVNSFVVLEQLVRAGAGIGRLPASYTTPRAQLCEVLRDYAAPARTTFAVYPTRRHISPALRAMIDVLVQVFQQEPTTS